MSSRPYRSIFFVEMEQLTGLAIGNGNDSLENGNRLSRRTRETLHSRYDARWCVCRGDCEDRPRSRFRTIVQLSGAELEYVAGRGLSGKKRGRLPRRKEDDLDFVQSLWSIDNALVDPEMEGAVLVQLSPRSRYPPQNERISHRAWRAI